MISPEVPLGMQPVYGLLPGCLNFRTIVWQQLLVIKLQQQFSKTSIK